MTKHAIVSAAEWQAARIKLMEKEKALTRASDALAAERRELPWMKLDKNYVFDSESGPRTLADLFGSRSQLVIYHLMFNPEWEAACKSCSFWADSFNPMIVHLENRDVTVAAISRAPIDKLAAFRRRMGWSFEWVSSSRNGFNYDFAVSFTPEQLKGDEKNYNFGTQKFRGEDAPGISVFVKESDGEIYRTYSCYARGLDILNAAYRYLDIVPKGRDEDGLSHAMSWVRLHDEYARQ
jgi:predicted dithiol-disulfide oxidoreductase (DUF899 family)